MTTGASELCFAKPGCEVGFLVLLLLPVAVLDRGGCASSKHREAS